LIQRVLDVTFHCFRRFRRVDEGTEKVLDLLQERGAIDTIYLTTFTYGRGLAGRQIPGHPFPDHGVQDSDVSFFHGGNYATPHPEYYRDTVLKQTRAPDHGNLEAVLGRFAEPGRLPASLRWVFGATSSTLGLMSGRGLWPLSRAISSRNC
jgi:hypothetical protein